MSSRYEREGDAPPAPEPLRVETVDAHCHLDLMGVEDDLATALALSASVGVPRVVTIGVDVETSRLAARQADAHPGILAAAAIHPNSADEATDEALRAIEALASVDRVRAIGETGLDYYRDTADVANQHRSFRAHIQIAKATGTALVIHDREAHDDVLRLLREEGAPERTVFHCFSGDAEMARTCADLGYYLSFAGNVTFKNAQHLRDAAALAPLDLLLVETDAPFLTPMPYRGRPNAPYLIPLTVRALAAVKGVDEDDVAGAVAANAERVFGAW
ncbi:MAG TPA: TatD family hydrolase [Frankiaceae bacterium]|nr:TatD family hydrolase [Frankiaceae bacterium]